jgi:hypothetical protein
VKIVRVYTGEDGESRFQDLEIELRDCGPIGRISQLRQATGIAFRETDGDYSLDFHCAPRRQFVINLDAAVEVEVGDGSKRVLQPGDILLAEDTSGRGHISRAVDGKARRSIFVTLD